MGAQRSHAASRRSQVVPDQREGRNALAEVAARLGVSEASLKWAVHKLRQRYRELVREEIAQTVSSAEEVDDEIRHLFSVLA